MTEITIKIEAPELVQAINTLAAALAGGTAPASHVVESTEGKPTRAPRAAKKSEPTTTPTESETPAPDAPATSEEVASPSAQENTGAVSTSGIAYDDVREKVLALTQKRGRDATVGLLAQFGNASGEPCATGKELVEDDWAEFIQKAVGLIEGELA